MSKYKINVHTNLNRNNLSYDLKVNKGQEKET